MGCGRVGSTLARSLERQRPRRRRHRPGRVGLPPARHRASRADRHRGRLRPRHPERGRHRGRLRLRRGLAAVTTPTSSPPAWPARRSASSTSWPASTTRGRAEVYQRLGIPTVATVKWTADQMLRRLLPQGHVPEFTDPSRQGRHRRGAAGRRPGSAAALTDIEDADRRPRRLPHPARRRACSPARTRSTRRATSSTSRSGATTSPRVERVLRPAARRPTDLAQERTSPMRVVIAGAGSVGRSIARELLAQRPPGAAHRPRRRRRPGQPGARGQLAARRRLRDRRPARGRPGRVRRRRGRDR